MGGALSSSPNDQRDWPSQNQTASNSGEFETLPLYIKLVQLHTYSALLLQVDSYVVLSMVDHLLTRRWAVVTEVQ